MKEILYNPDNLKKEDIDEVVVRVKALIINSNNEITLGYAHKTYQFPGGHIEQGETLEEGLIREIKEETGIELNIKIPSPFQKTTYYTKNYRDSGLNRENDIYYYVIETDQVFDMSNTCLDQHEIEGNYICKTIPLDEFEEILMSSINDNPQNEVIVSEMLVAFNEYKRIKEK